MERRIDALSAGRVAWLERSLGTLLLALAALIPCIQVGARILDRPGIAGAGEYLQHLVLWIAFACGTVTSSQGRHLAFTVAYQRIAGKARTWIGIVTAAVSAFFCTILCIAGLSFVLLSFEPGATAGGIPLRILALVMPAGFALMAARFILRCPTSPRLRWAAALGIPAGILFSTEALAGVFVSLSAANPQGAPGRIAALLQTADAALSALRGAAHLPLISLLVASALLGAPIFVLVGGLACLFFIHAGGSLAVLPNQAYTVLTGPFIPALPLFTLAGYILSESKAGERLVRLFRALFGWLPGGLTIMSVVLCTFLTAFTGASGVTILVVGGLLHFVLTSSSYKESFSTGLLTASSSVGLLFPPCLPVILYGVVAQVDIRAMYVGGLLPGLFMILALSALGVAHSLRQKVPRVPFRLLEAIDALRGAALEILLPVIVLLFYFLGIMAVVETAAFSVVYVFLTEVLVHRDIRLRRIPEVFLKAATIIGGVLIILAVANGLSYFIVDAQISEHFAGWLHASVRSKYVFLLLLNLALLVKGIFMDVFSAIAVLVPLILPVAAAYGIHPIHLGIIFLANLELGYLTPPVGLNLQFAAYRFNRPASSLIRDVAPFLLVLLAAVLLITYLPAMTTILLDVFRFSGASSGPAG